MSLLKYLLARVLCALAVHLFNKCKATVLQYFAFSQSFTFTIITGLWSKEKAFRELFLHTEIFKLYFKAHEIYCYLPKDLNQCVFASVFKLFTEIRVNVLKTFRRRITIIWILIYSKELKELLKPRRTFDCTIQCEPLNLIFIKMETGAAEGRLEF